MVDDKPDWGYGGASGDAMRAYEETLARPLFDPWARLLIEELALDPGEHLLDVATGPGTLARLAAARLGPKGRVVACDLSPAMLALAIAKPAVPNGAPIDYLECPADSLTLATGAFDVVTCQQGLQFFPDRLAALAEMRRVLKPGGRLGVAVWSEIDRCPPIAALTSAIGAVMGEAKAHSYSSGPWGFPSADELHNLITSAGFDQVRVVERQLPVVFESGPSQLVASLAASGISNEVARLDPEQRAALDQKAAKLLAPLVIGSGVESQMASNIGLAVKEG